MYLILQNANSLRDREVERLRVHPFRTMASSTLTRISRDQ